MGDDLYGQCGQGANNRSSFPPFFENKIIKPVLVNNLPKIKKISSNGNHTIVLSNDGIVYGWGSNDQM